MIFILMRSKIIKYSGNMMFNVKRIEGLGFWFKLSI